MQQSTNFTKKGIKLILVNGVGCKIKGNTLYIYPLSIHILYLAKDGRDREYLIYVKVKNNINNKEV